MCKYTFTLKCFALIDRIRPFGILLVDIYSLKICLANAEANILKFYGLPKLEIASSLFLTLNDIFLGILVVEIITACKTCK